VLTRKFFKKVAKEIRSRSLSPQEKEKLIEILISIFEKENPRFDATRFREACYDT